jgi:hypothetical protein
LISSLPKQELLAIFIEGCGLKPESSIFFMQSWGKKQETSAVLVEDCGLKSESSVFLCSREGKNRKHPPFWSKAVV